MAGTPRRLLILGGTGEAFDLARRLGGRPDLLITSALAGRTRRPRLPAGRVRIGGFGGAAGLARYLRERGIDLLVDATHPFAVRIGAHAAVAAAEVGVARLALRRPAGPPPDRPATVEAQDLAAALGDAGVRGRRVLVTFRLDRVPDEARRLDIVVRAVEPPIEAPPANVVWRLGRGPYRNEDERRLLERLRIEVVVAKASGGAAAAAKLEAARRLGLPVVLITRPDRPPGRNVATSVADAVAWIDAQLRALST